MLFRSIFSLLWTALALAQAPERLHGGYELTITVPPAVLAKTKDSDEYLKIYRQALTQQGMEVHENYVRDPKTRAVFTLSIDLGPVVEVQTPPLRSEQVETVLKPFFEAAHSLRWPHKKGGGHIHLDASVFEKNPKKFLNFLIQFHNHPILDRFFYPVERNEATIFQRGFQREFTQAIEKLRQLPHITWDDVQEQLKGLWEKNGSWNLRWKTLELRAINVQKNSQEARLQLEFYEALWNHTPSDHLLQPKQWSYPEYNRELSVKEYAQRAARELKNLGLSPEHYSVFIEKYQRRRLKGHVEALAKHKPGMVRYLETEAEIEENIIRLLHSGKDKHILEAWRAGAALGWRKRPEWAAAFQKSLNESDLFLNDAAWGGITRFEWQKIPELRATVLQTMKSPDPFRRKLALTTLGTIDWLREDADFVAYATDSVLTNLAHPDSLARAGAIQAVQAVDWTQSPKLQSAILKTLHDVRHPARIYAVRELGPRAFRVDSSLLNSILPALSSTIEEYRGHAWESITLFPLHEIPELEKEVYSILSQAPLEVRESAWRRLRGMKWQGSKKIEALIRNSWNSALPSQQATAWAVLAERPEWITPAILEQAKTLLDHRNVDLQRSAQNVLIHQRHDLPFNQGYYRYLTYKPGCLTRVIEALAIP